MQVSQPIVHRERGEEMMEEEEMSEFTTALRETTLVMCCGGTMYRIMHENVHMYFFLHALSHVRVVGDSGT